MSNKKKYQTITTPFATLRFGALNKPSTKFNKAGQYEATIVLNTEEAETKKFVEAVMAAANAAKAEFVKADKKVEKFKLCPEFAPDKDRDTDEDIENTIRINAKRQVSGERTDGTKWTANIDRFDSKGKPMPQSLEIGWGSTVRLALTLKPFVMPATKSVGVSLQLSGVQVKDLQAPGGRTAEGYGFGAVDGFEAGEEAADAPASDGEAAPAGATNEDADDFL